MQILKIAHPAMNKMFGTRVCIVAALWFSTAIAGNADYKTAKSIYDFTAKDIHGNDVSLERYRGHVSIIVNVASECGLTSKNYAQLNHLYDRYADSKGLRILAFPSNDFAGQEPGSDEEISKFAKSLGVKFDMFSKVEVNGANAHPLWKYLKEQQGGFLVDAIKWNFTKFLIDKNGQVVDRFSPSTDPNDMVDELEKLFGSTNSPKEFLINNCEDYC